MDGLWDYLLCVHAEDLVQLLMLVRLLFRALDRSQLRRELDSVEVGLRFSNAQHREVGVVEDGRLPVRVAAVGIPDCVEGVEMLFRGGFVDNHLDVLDLILLNQVLLKQEQVVDGQGLLVDEEILKDGGGLRR